MDGAISKQEQDQVFATRDQSHAEHEQLQAAIQQAEATVKQQQALIEAATSNLHLAELNMHRAAVIAPADGTLSNFDMRPGNYVQVGQAVAALLDRKQLYVVGYFEETKLNRIHVGDQASVQLMGDSQKIRGHVQGIASGIEDRERSSSSKLLANVNPTFSWVRLAQRVPVKSYWMKHQRTSLLSSLDVRQLCILSRIKRKALAFLLILRVKPTGFRYQL